MNNTIRRGDIFFCKQAVNDGSPQSSDPVLVIQADEINAKSPTILIAAITDAAFNQYRPTHVILPESNIFKHRAMVRLEQIRTVDRSDLTDFAGVVDDEDTWREINKAVRKVFGLWVYRNKRVGDVRCLCPNCLNDYKQITGIVVKRFDSFQSTKSKCDKCNGRGYDYIIYDKKRAID